MAALITGRVVEIWCSTGESTGSGYLLGNGLVLTARHVLDRDKSGTKPTKIIARKVNTEAWRNATLVWPSDAAELAQQEVDAALIQIDDWVDAKTSAPPVRIGPANDEIGNAVPVGAVGFPKFTEANNRRDTDEITGIVRPGATMELGRYQIENVTFRDDSRNKAALDWTGFSGSALISQNRIVGVVITAKREQRYDFSAVRMERILAAPGFLDKVGGAVQQDGVQESAPVDLGRLTCLLGRDPQETFFKGHYQEAVARVAEGASPKAMLVLVPGAADGEHCPEDLALRFSLSTLARHKWPSSEWVWLRWLDDPDAATVLSNLRDALWEKLCTDPTEATPADPLQFRHLLEKGRPRLFKSNLTGFAPKPSLARIISDWSQFWGALSNLTDRRPPIHLLLVQPPDQETTKQWLVQAPGFEGTVTKALPHLTDCTRLEFREWVDERLKGHVDERARGHLDRALSPTYDTVADFKMLRLKNTVKGIPVDV